MTENRKTGWAFWTVVPLLIVLVAYPLSYGPACWLIIRAGLPENGRIAVQAVYAPVNILRDAIHRTRFEFINEMFAAYNLWWIDLAYR